MAESAPASLLDPPVAPKFTNLFMDGQFVGAKSGKVFPTEDPRSRKVIAQVAEGDAEDVDIAVKAARKAFEKGPWPRMTGYERGRVLHKLADLIEQHSDELAALETLDNGMPLMATRHLVLPQVVAVVRSQAGWADKIAGSTLKTAGSFHAYTLYEPYGVVGVILPWNGPLLILVLKIAPALVCGNTVVVKPAEQTPLTALYIANLSLEAGIPPGVFNVVTGYGETAGAAISSHMDIDKIAFTGSVEVGKLVMEAAAKSNLKPVQLELGGKSPLIIWEDADIDLAVELSHLGIFTNMGQVCFASSRLFVHENIYNQFIEKAVVRAKKRVIGDSFRPEVEHGPQISSEQVERIMSYIESGKKQGAKVVAGGKRVQVDGLFIEPTIFCDVQDDMKIAQEEIFGPVLCVMKFKDMEEVIERANRTIYGLAAGIVTQNIDIINRLSRSLKAGTVWVNTYLVVDPSVPLGGFKLSGFGRELGLEGLLGYMQTKSVIIPLQNSPWL